MDEKFVAFTIGHDLKPGPTHAGVRFENAVELANRLRGRSGYPFPSAADLAVDIDNAIKRGRNTGITSIDDEKKAALRAAVEDWLQDVGFLRLPRDVRDLRVALLELAAAESRGRDN
jgi:hypothetical protein